MDDLSMVYLLPVIVGLL